MVSQEELLASQKRYFQNKFGKRFGWLKRKGIISVAEAYEGEVTSSYDRGFVAGQANGYQTGYDAGYAVGFSAGVASVEPPEGGG